MKVSEPVISITNLKNGVGCSSLTWNIAHILELDIYQHDKAMHKFFLDERVNRGNSKSRSVSVQSIGEDDIKSGVYDLGADITPEHVQQILNKSNVVVIPIEVGAESLMKTIETIQYVAQHNKECDIFLVFNKLDNLDTKRERKYTEQSVFKIEDLDEEIVNRIQFYYIRYAFSMFRNLDEGYCLLDNFIHSGAAKGEISNFQLLQHLRYYTLKRMSESERENDKAEREITQSLFYEKHTSLYKDFEQSVDIPILFDRVFLSNNRKIIKDMLILTTRIKGIYSLIWEKTT